VKGVTIGEFEVNEAATCASVLVLSFPFFVDVVVFSTIHESAYQVDEPCVQESRMTSGWVG
jgi:hypothetical protein